MNRTLEPTRCISEGWQAFTANPWLAIGGVLLYGVVTIMGSFIPLLGILFSWFVGPALVGGLMLFALNLAGNGSPQLEDLLAGFERYGRLLGAYWLMMLIAFVGMLPTFLVVMLTAAGGVDYYEHDPSLEIVFFMFANIFVLLLIILRWSLVFFVIMDEPMLGVIDAFKRSSQITVGNRGWLLLLYILIAIVTMLGIFVFIVGYVVTATIGLIALARGYLWLKSFHPPVGVLENQVTSQ